MVGVSKALLRQLRRPGLRQRCDYVSPGSQATTAIFTLARQVMLVVAGGEAERLWRIGTRFAVALGRIHAGRRR